MPLLIINEKLSPLATKVKLHVKYQSLLNIIIASKVQQESPAIADKPARRESLPKIAPIRRAYNVVADNTGLSSFV